MALNWKDSSDGQLLVALWAVVVIVLLVGLVAHIGLLVLLAVIGGAGAGYTTYMYVQEATGGARAGSPADDADRNEGTKP